MPKAKKLEQNKNPKVARTARRQAKISELRQKENSGVYSKYHIARKDEFWKQSTEHENSGKFASMIKGIDMDYITNIPVSESVAESINPEYFKDPYLVAKKSLDFGIHSPKFDRKDSLFGHYKIRTVKEQQRYANLQDEPHHVSCLTLVC